VIRVAQTPQIEVWRRNIDFHGINGVSMMKGNYLGTQFTGIY
jgi:hypothetical protein